MAYNTSVVVHEELELGYKSMVVTVKKDGNIVGHFMVGRASLFWFDKNKKNKANGTSWDDLIAHMKSLPPVRATMP